MLFYFIVQFCSCNICEPCITETVTDDATGRSDSPFIDVERVSSDEEPEKQDGK